MWDTVNPDLEPGIHPNLKNQIFGDFFFIQENVINKQMFSNVDKKFHNPLKKEKCQINLQGSKVIYVCIYTSGYYTSLT